VFKLHQTQRSRLAADRRHGACSQPPPPAPDAAAAAVAPAARRRSSLREQRVAIRLLASREVPKGIGLASCAWAVCLFLVGC